MPTVMLNGQVCQLVTYAEAARRCGTYEKWVHRQIELGNLETAYHLGRNYVTDRSIGELMRREGSVAARRIGGCMGETNYWFAAQREEDERMRALGFYTTPTPSSPATPKDARDRDILDEFARDFVEGQ